MSENGKHIRSYTVSDIEKYLGGKLSASEMHAMEKAALDDPFLADALEGFETIAQQNASVNIDADITELKQRLADRIKERKKSTSPVFMFWRVAAAVVIILGVGGITFNYIIKNSKTKSAIAESTQKAATPDSPIANNDFAKPDSLKNIDIVSNRPTTKPGLLEKKSEKKNYFAPVRESDSLISGLKKEPVLQAEKTEKKNATANIVKNIEPALHIDSIKPAPMPSAEVDRVLEGKVAGLSITNSKHKKAFTNILEGKVVDANNEPVAGATVFTKKNKNAVVTDNNGFFRFKNENKNPSIDVTVNSVGFQSVAATLNNNSDSENIIHLQPASASLNEVVVMGYGGAKKTDVKKSDDEDEDVFIADSLPHKAMPVVGWAAFKKYIDQHKITTLDTAVSGEEIFSFRLDSTGKMSSFRIISSLSDAHYKEAVRLLMNGPKWQLLEGKNARIKMTINF